MSTRQLIGFRVVCGAAVDQFDLRQAAVECIGRLRNAGRPAIGFTVLRVNGREVLKRLRLRRNNPHPPLKEPVMAKNSIDAYGALGKSNVLFFDPETLVLVTDEASPLSTSPMTWAERSTNAVGVTRGHCPR